MGDCQGRTSTLEVTWARACNAGQTWPEALAPPLPLCLSCTPLGPAALIAAPAPALIFSLTPVVAPVRFLRELQAQEVDEGATAHLRCELSRAGASVEWLKGYLQLFPCAKYQMVLEGTAAELLVHGAEQEDAGPYTCDTGHAQSTASLSVRGEPPRTPALPRPLSPHGAGRRLEEQP